MKIHIAGRRQRRQAPGLVQQGDEELVAVAATLQTGGCLHTDIDAVPVVKDEKPGIALLGTAPYAEAVAIAKIVVLFLPEHDAAELVQPGGV